MKRLLYIILGFYVSYSLSDYKNLYAIIAVIGFLFALSNIIALIDVLNGKDVSLKEMLIFYIYPLVIGLIIVFFLSGISALDNILQSHELFLEYGRYGLFFLFVVILIGYKKKHSFSFYTFIISIVLIPLSFIFGAALINVNFSDFPINRKMKIERKRINKYGKDSIYNKYWIIFSPNIDSCTVTKERWMILKENDTVQVKISKGILGYDYIRNVKNIKNHQ